jgi:FolB domain-containing protein
VVAKLKVKDMSTWVRLGCTEAERTHTQEVKWTLEFEFNEVPAATETDRLSDTLCYAKSCEVLLSLTARGEYATVEKLGYEAFQRIKDLVGSKTQLRLHLHKVRPPIPHLEGGVVFTLEG